MTDIAIEDSLMPLEQQNNDLTAYLDEMRDSVRKKSNIDFEESKKARTLCETLKKDYSKISKRMRLQNQSSSSIVDSFKNIGNEEGMMKKVSATGKLIGTALSRVPGIKQTKNLLSHAGSVSAGLEDQFGLLIKVNQEIYDMLYGDEGIKSTLAIIRTNYQNYGNKLIKIKDKKVELNSALEKVEREKFELIDPLLEQYHVDDFDSIDTLKLDSDSMAAYQRIEQIDMNLEDMKYTISEYKSMEERLINHRDGTKVQLNTIGVYLVQGKDIYNSINELIDNAATGKISTKLVTTLEGLITEGSTISVNLIENFNEILEKTAQHAEELTKESDKLIPKFVYRGNSLNIVDKSNNNALEYLRKNGQLRKYQRALSGAEESPPTRIEYNQEDK